MINYERLSNGDIVGETEFTRTWEARHGHRWVRVGGQYYPASDRALALAHEKARGIVISAPIGDVR